MIQADLREVARKAELASILDSLCQGIELTETQFARGKQHYEAVGSWLAEGEQALFKGVSIYPQGSVAIGTTVRPIGKNEHDVDLVCFLPALTSSLPPILVKKVVGDRLGQNGRYKDILEEFPRCWRINYAGDFHLDITPSIEDPSSYQGGELVPDKKLQTWKASNPKGYKTLFERRANILPPIRAIKQAMYEARGREVEPFPIWMNKKGILRRIVQLAKCHRDFFFRQKPEIAPISVIITTLAAKSYERCALGFVYDSELDLILDVVSHMPDFIERRSVHGTTLYSIPNETTVGENFAEKWNVNPDLAYAFFDWHSGFCEFLRVLGNTVGADQIQEKMASAFGSSPVKKAFEIRTKEISQGREDGRLTYSPTMGITVASTIGTPVPHNTFFGRMPL